MYFNEELKINCLKFISLNIVSFFSEGSKLAENLIGLQNQTQVLFELRDELDEFNFENKLVISNLLSQVH